MHQTRTPRAASFLALDALLPITTAPVRLALAYYARAAYTAGQGSPHVWPPLLALGILWARTEGRDRLEEAAGRWEDAALLLLGLLLSRVLALLAARARRRRAQQRQQQQEQEQEQERAPMVPATPERRWHAAQEQPEEGEEGGLRQLQPEDVSASPPPATASDFSDARTPLPTKEEASAPSVALRDHEEKVEAEAEPNEPSGAAMAAACGGP